MTRLMRCVVLAAAFTACGAVQAYAAATVVKTYQEGTYQYTCIDSGGALYCGNWNVVH